MAAGFVKTMGESASTRGVEGLPKRIGGVPLGAALTGLASAFSTGRPARLFCAGAGWGVAAAFLSVASGSTVCAAAGAFAGTGLCTATGAAERVGIGVGVTGIAGSGVGDAPAADGPGTVLGVEGAVASGALETASASDRVKIQIAATAASTKVPKLSHKAQFTLCLLFAAEARIDADCCSPAIGGAACGAAAADNNEGMAVRSATVGRGGKGAGMPTLCSLSAIAPAGGANPAPEPMAAAVGEDRGTSCARG